MQDVVAPAASEDVVVGVADERVVERRAADALDAAERVNFAACADDDLACVEVGDDRLARIEIFEELLRGAADENVVPRATLEEKGGVRIAAADEGVVERGSVEDFDIGEAVDLGPEGDRAGVDIEHRALVRVDVRYFVQAALRDIERGRAEVGAGDGVVAVAGQHLIEVAAGRTDHVVAVAGVDQVVAAAAVDHVIARGADDDFVG